MIEFKNKHLTSSEYGKSTTIRTFRTFYLVVWPVSRLSAGTQRKEEERKEFNSSTGVSDLKVYRKLLVPLS